MLLVTTDGQQIICLYLLTPLLEQTADDFFSPGVIVRVLLGLSVYKNIRKAFCGM